MVKPVMFMEGSCPGRLTQKTSLMPSEGRSLPLGASVSGWLLLGYGLKKHVGDTQINPSICAYIYVHIYLSMYLSIYLPTYVYIYIYTYTVFLLK